MRHRKGKPSITMEGRALSALRNSLESRAKKIGAAVEKLKKRDAPDVERVKWDVVKEAALIVFLNGVNLAVLFLEQPVDLVQIQKEMEVFFDTLHDFLLASHRSKVGAGLTCRKMISDSEQTMYKESIQFLWRLIPSSGEVRAMTDKMWVLLLINLMWVAYHGSFKLLSSNINAARKSVIGDSRLIVWWIHKLESPPSGDMHVGSIKELTVAVCTDTIDVFRVLLKQVLEFGKEMNDIDELIHYRWFVDEFQNIIDFCSYVQSLDLLVEFCHEVAEQVSELACFFTFTDLEHEANNMKTILNDIYNKIGQLEEEVDNLRETGKADFRMECNKLKSKINELKIELDHSNLV